MEQDVVTRAAAVLAVTACLGLPAAASGAPTEYSLDGGHLGQVAVYAPDGVPGSVVLFVSGDGGWNSEVAGMARQLRSWGALVAGIDVRRCVQASTPTAEFQQLGHALEKRAGLKNYQAPILIGYSSGAGLTYTLAREAPRGAFAGVISLGFCADPPVPAHGKVPTGVELGVPWVAMHGALDQVCSAEATRIFVAGIPGAKFVLLPNVGHGYSLEGDWLPQFLDAYLKLVTATTEPAITASAVADLPLAEVPARNVAVGPAADTFVVLLTGDGGWAGLDKDVAAALAARGVPVVAWSTLRYFWRQRTPQNAARDLDRIVRHYTVAWRRHQVLLVGYSFGANVLPFVVGQLPPTARHAIRGLSLLAPARHASFEIHVADWIPGSVPEGQPVQPAVEVLKGTQILCLYGAEERDSLCAALPPDLARTVKLPGDHHFGGDSATLASEILGFMGL